MARFIPLPNYEPDRSPEPVPEQEEPSVREALAAYAHEAWSGWMQYLFNPERGGHSRNGWRICSESYERWSRQAHTAYADLPEKEKHSDRDEADKMLALMKPCPSCANLREASRKWGLVMHELMDERDGYKAALEKIADIAIEALGGGK